MNSIPGNMSSFSSPLAIFIQTLKALSLSPWYLYSNAWAWYLLYFSSHVLQSCISHAGSDAISAVNSEESVSAYSFNKAVSISCNINICIQMQKYQKKKKKKMKCCQKRKDVKLQELWVFKLPEKSFRIFILLPKLPTFWNPCASLVPLISCRNAIKKFLYSLKFSSLPLVSIRTSATSWSGGWALINDVPAGIRWGYREINWNKTLNNIVFLKAFGLLICYKDHVKLNIQYLSNI